MSVRLFQIYCYKEAAARAGETTSSKLLRDTLSARAGEGGTLSLKEIHIENILNCSFQSSVNWK